MDHEAQKVVALYPFYKPRDQRYNFLQPFQTAMEYKLAHFFGSPGVPKTHVDEFFRNGLISAGSDASLTTLLYHSAYYMYNKIEEMVMDPQCKNRVIDFKLAKNTEFWYWDIMFSLKCLLWGKSFATHMVWARIQHFDCNGKKVYTPMQSGSWWWDTQPLPSKSHDLLPLTGYFRWSFQLAHYWSPSYLHPMLHIRPSYLVMVTCGLCI